MALSRDHRARLAKTKTTSLAENTNECGVNRFFRLSLSLSLSRRFLEFLRISVLRRNESFSMRWKRSLQKVQLRENRHASSRAVFLVRAIINAIDRLRF